MLRTLHATLNIVDSELAKRSEKELLNRVVSEYGRKKLMCEDD